MNKISVISAALLGSALAACGGGSGSPSKPDLCGELNATNCNQVVVPSSTSSSVASSLAPPLNNILPFTEKFNVDSALQLFTPAYKSLLNPGEDTNPAFYYSTSGLDAGRIVATPGKLTFGNARLTIGQRLQTTGTHIDPAALPLDYKVNTTTDGTAANFPTTTTWGELDLSHSWKISFCVREAEALSGSTSNQQFMVYVDNNQSNSSFSLHGSKSLVKQLNVSQFVAGKRVEINIPGEVFIDGKSIDTVLQNPGTTSSFIQLRVPSAGVVTMSDLWVGYQSDKASEPVEGSCTTGERVPGWNVPPPAADPTTAPVVTAKDSQLEVSWSPLLRATAYQVAHNTANTTEGAVLSADIVGNTVTDYTIKDLQNNQPYYVFLRGKNSAGVATAWSTSTAGTPQPASTPPAVPQVPTLVAGDAQIEVSWTPVENASTYQVAYNTVDNPASATVFGEPLSATSTVITGLTNDLPYYVYVRATNSAGTSEYSPAGTATPKAPVVTAWVGEVVDLIGGATVPEVGTAPTGSVTADGEAIVLRATGGILNQATGFRNYFAHKTASGEFVFTARIASVTTASGAFTGPGNSYGYGLMVMQEIPTAPVTVYANVPRFATLNLYTEASTLNFKGSRATKVDSASGNRSRSDVPNAVVGSYLRIEVFNDTATPGQKRVRRLTSPDGVTWTQENSTLWTGTNVGNDWQVGFFAAPGAEDLFIRFENVELKPYEAVPASSSSAASSVAPSSSAPSSTAASSSSDAGSSVAPSSSSAASSDSSSSSSSVTGGGTSSDSSSSSSAAAAIVTTWGFDAATITASVSASAATDDTALFSTAPAGDQLAKSSTIPRLVDGLYYYANAVTVPLRYRVATNVWNFNGSSFASNARILPADGQTLDPVTHIPRMYIGIPVTSGTAVSLAIKWKHTNTANYGRMALIDQNGVVLKSVAANTGATDTLTLDLTAGHSVSEVRILFSRENGGTSGGLDIEEIVRTYP
ncbi:MAG TPA: fibronectin type III domain-containing protein [Cellvibrio sp.]|nr:fibronectin type III domain-containing protein [Cellvibrio sp.]